MRSPYAPPAQQPLLSHYSSKTRYPYGAFLWTPRGPAVSSDSRTVGQSDRWTDGRPEDGHTIKVIGEICEICGSAPPNGFLP